MKTRISGLFAAAAVAALAGQAAAAIVTVTYTGTVSSGYDERGLFGPAGANLAGDAYAAVYHFNTEIGRSPSCGAGGCEAQGGSDDGDASPSLGSTFTINGVTLSFSGDYNALTEADSGYQQQYAYDSYFYAAGNETFLNGSDNFAEIADLPSSIDTPFSANLSAGYVGGYFEDGISPSEYDGFELTPLTETVTVAGMGVPEPATWATLLLGLLVVGAALRRRKHPPLPARA